MGIFASVFALIGRFLGRVLSMAMGWATILLFGRVPQSKQALLSLISLGSLAWVVALLGVVFPRIGALIVSFAPVPDALAGTRVAGLDVESWIRIAMLVAALVVPILIGIGGFFLLDKADRPKGAGIGKQVLRGYPYAAVLAVSMAFMIVIAPARKLRSMAKRWSDAHISVVVKPGGYEVVADDLERALDSAGLDIERTRAPRVLEAPSKLLAAVAGSDVRRLVPERLIQLGNRDLEVLIYPSDISIIGKRDLVARARAAIASRLTFTAAYLTTSEEAQRIEDRLERIWVKVPAVKAAADALSPAVAAQTGGGGRVAAARAVDEARDAGPDTVRDRERGERAGAATAATGAPDATADVPTGSGTAVSIADAIPVDATRSQILAAGHVAPPDAREPDDGLDPATFETMLAELKAIDRGLAQLVIPHDEWEVLYRLRLQVERDVLVTRDVVEGRVDGETRLPHAGLETLVIRGIGVAAAAVERVLDGTTLGRAAGVVRQVLPEPAQPHADPEVEASVRSAAGPSRPGDPASATDPP